MGCDIHLFIEYKRKPNNIRWVSLGSEFRLDRHYGVFASLANVRNDGSVHPVYEPRGVPSDIGNQAADKYYRFVIEDNTLRECDEIIKSDAEKWVKQGVSEWVDKYHITDPDAHSGSWLTPDEFEIAINAKVCGEMILDTDEYIAVLAAMRSLEKAGHEVRTVFWFDN